MLPLGPGLKATIESIDNRSDFKQYMQNYAYAHGGVTRGPRRTGPEHEGFVRYCFALPTFCSHGPSVAAPIATTC
jgi:hypothetical protein